VKRNIHPAVAIAIIVAAVLAVGYLVMQRTQYDVGQTHGPRFVKPKSK